MFCYSVRLSTELGFLCFDILLTSSGGQNGVSEKRLSCCTKTTIVQLFLPLSARKWAEKRFSIAPDIKLTTVCAKSSKKYRFWSRKSLTLLEKLRYSNWKFVFNPRRTVHTLCLK